jgi:porphobilinogen synthase
MTTRGDTTVNAEPTPGTATRPEPLSGLNPLRGRAPMRQLLERQPVEVADLVMPLLVRSNDDGDASVRLPSVTLGDLSEEVRQLADVGIRAVKLFASGERKDLRGSEAVDPDTLMIRAIKACKVAAPSLCVMTETCLCPYTVEGSCVSTAEDGSLDLDGTLELLADAAVLQADAGADSVGPAPMMDGSVRAVRAALDANGWHNVSIMPHVIFSSCLYGGYRQTMRTAPRRMNRQAFQVHPSRPEQAIDLARRFRSEGADMLLLEPAMFGLDILVRLRAILDCPLVPFSVSGEYAMLTGSLPSGVPDALDVLLEFLTSLKRAGADLVITYAAKDIARALKEQ